MTWSTKQLGNHCPEALIRTVRLNNTMHFGCRARDERRRVLLGDLEVRKKEGGEKRQYIIWHTERGSKTRIYTTGTDRCPVKFFKSYLARQPTDMGKPENHLYLTVIKNPKLKFGSRNSLLENIHWVKRWLQRQNWKESALTTEIAERLLQR